MTDPSFAQPLKKLAESGIGVAAAPTGGMGLALDARGWVPAAALVEGWHEIGAQSEPAFEGTWVNFDSTRLARFCKDALGFVHLGGVIRSGTINTTAFTLPLGYRPAYALAGTRLSFAVDSNGAHGRLSVGSDGSVVPDIGNNAFVFLDGVNFRAA